MSVPFVLLVPTDFSSCSEKAVMHAVNLAESNKCSVHLVHVVVNDAEAAPFIMPSAKSDYIGEKLKSNAETELRLIADKYFKSKNIECFTHVSEGEPYEEILKISKEVAAELIVISPGEKSFVDKLIYGSTSKQIIKKAECNIFVAKFSDTRSFVSV